MVLEGRSAGYEDENGHASGGDGDISLSCQMATVEVESCHVPCAELDF